MYRHFNYFMEKDVLTLHPGEFWVSQKEEILSTVLGSCVSVILYDPRLCLSGMNHFMLPGMVNEKTSSELFLSEPGKYGLYAMELLINEMLKQGAVKTRLQAKIFGGGSVLQNSTDADGKSLRRNQIPENNVRFAQEFLLSEDIPVISTDTGGEFARKILLFPREFRILLKRYSPSSRIALERKNQELQYAQEIKKDLSRRDITIFFNEDDTP